MAFGVLGMVYFVVGTVLKRIWDLFVLLIHNYEDCLGGTSISGWHWFDVKAKIPDLMLKLTYLIAPNW